MSKQNRVAVIGAGVTGVTTAGTCEGRMFVRGGLNNRYLLTHPSPIRLSSALVQPFKMNQRVKISLFFLRAVST